MIRRKQTRPYVDVGDGVGVEVGAGVGVDVGAGVGVEVGDGVGEDVGEASNTIDDPVPMIAATTIRRPSTWPATLDVLVHAAEVAEVQLVVEHEALASEREAEGSEIPNCKPEMVSCAPPESGAFTLCDEDTTGAAKEDQCTRFELTT
jgi:hypothetical protein